MLDGINIMMVTGMLENLLLAGISLLLGFLLGVRCADVVTRKDGDDD